MSFLSAEKLKDIYRKLCQHGNAKPLNNGDRIPLKCQHLLPLHECHDPDCVKLCDRLVTLESETKAARKWRNHR